MECTTPSPQKKTILNMYDSINNNIIVYMFIYIMKTSNRISAL
jgi:hypothetical protein